jgi:hypothetical protein
MLVDLFAMFTCRIWNLKAPIMRKFVPGEKIAERAMQNGYLGVGG